MDPNQNYGGQYLYAGQGATSYYPIGPTQESSAVASGPKETSVLVTEKLSDIDPLIEQYVTKPLRKNFKAFLLDLMFALFDIWLNPSFPDIHVTLEYDRALMDVELKIWVYADSWDFTIEKAKIFENHLSGLFNQNGTGHGWDRVHLVWQIWFSGTTFSREEAHWSSQTSLEQPLSSSLRCFPGGKLCLGWFTARDCDTGTHRLWLMSYRNESMAAERGGWVTRITP